jgi:hypothetical protein
VVLLIDIDQSGDKTWRPAKRFHDGLPEKKQALRFNPVALGKLSLRLIGTGYACFAPG